MEYNLPRMICLIIGLIVLIIGGYSYSSLHSHETKYIYTKYTVHSGSENQEWIQNFKYRYWFGRNESNYKKETRVAQKNQFDAKLKDYNGPEYQRTQNINMDDNNYETNTWAGYDRQFDAYLKKFNKVYDASEYLERFLNFMASLEEINRLNDIEGAIVFGLTKFSDMSKEEFVQRMLLKPSDVRKTCYEKHKVCVDTESHDNNMLKRYVADLPTNFDWRKKGFVSPVLDQKLCLGCWAFSIVGVMESMAAIQGIDHVRRSIQELIDCSYYNNGCKGGSVYLALDYLCKSKPVKIVTEEEYPLTLSGEKVCKIPAKPIGRQLKEFTLQCQVEEDKMVRQVATHGPLVAIVDATNWMNYIGGVIRRACSAEVSNHVIQVVGYANYNTSEVPYFLIKNSFGEDFGDDGYVKIGLYGNVCGIRNQVTMLEVV